MLSLPGQQKLKDALELVEDYGSAYGHVETVFFLRCSGEFPPLLNPHCWLSLAVCYVLSSLALFTRRFLFLSSPPPLAREE